MRWVFGQEQKQQGVVVKPVASTVPERGCVGEVGAGLKRYWKLQEAGFLANLKSPMPTQFNHSVPKV
jgi:hypothetical protein